MQRFVFSVFIVLFLQLSLSAQEYEEFVFEDGTTVDVKINSLDPDAGLIGNVYAGFFTPTGHLNFIGYNHYIPTKMYLNGSIGLNGGLIDGSFLLFNKLKNKNLKQSVKSTYGGNTTTRYVAKIPSTKRRSIGIHTGIEVLNAQFEEDFTKQAVGFIGGISILGARYANLAMKSFYTQRQGSLVNRLNIDFIWYPIRSISRDLLPDESIDKFLGPNGIRIYYDGRSSVWNRDGQLTLNYMFGVNVSTDPNATPLIIGLGLGYGFKS